MRVEVGTDKLRQLLALRAIGSDDHATLGTADVLAGNGGEP